MRTPPSFPRSTSNTSIVERIISANNLFSASTFSCPGTMDEDDRKMPANDSVVAAHRPEVDFFTEEFIRTQEELWRQFSRSAPSGSEEHRWCSTSPPRVGGYPDSSTANMVGDKEDDLLSSLFEDAALIEEQRRILEELQQEHQQKSCNHKSSSSRSKAYGNARSLSNNTCTTTASSEDSLAASSRLSFSRQSSSSTTNLEHQSKNKANMMNDNHDSDQMVRLGNQRLKIKGTRHAYDAISNGSATIVQCSSCQAILQVGSTARLVYCVNCQQVTPIEVARNVIGGRIGATDRHIAKSIQMQEVDTAWGRKSC